MTLSKNFVSRSQIAVPVCLALSAKPLGSCTNQKPRNRMTRRATPFFSTPVIECSLRRGKVEYAEAHAHTSSLYQDRASFGCRRARFEALQEQVRGGVRIALTGHHLGRELVQRRVLVYAAPLLAQRGHGDRLDLVACPAEPSLVQLTARGEVLEVLLQGGHQVVDALALAGDRLDDLGPPRTVRSLGQREHRAQVTSYLVGAVAVGLVDDVDVADLEDPGLGGLDAVAHPRRDQHHRGVGEAGDLDLALA